MKLTFLLLLSVSTLGLAQQSYYDVTYGNGNGIRFWSSDHYKIHMGNLPEYNFGPVTGYSIKFNMNSFSGWGWVWGIDGQPPIAALSNEGLFEIAGAFTAGNGLRVGTANSQKIKMSGSLSDYIISMQDGTGRVQHYWNSSNGTSPTYLVSNEPAGKLSFNPGGSDLFSVKMAPSGTAGAAVTWNEYFWVGTNGKVGIGTITPDEKLTIKGTIHAQEIKVDLSVPGPDYVFAKDYALPSLESVQSFINQNQHLPEVPSAKEMEEKGVKLGEMNMLLLKKVEELTLYLLELKKENDERMTANLELQSRVDALEAKIKNQ